MQAGAGLLAASFINPPEGAFVTNLAKKFGGLSPAKFSHP
jgi:hypothetical protein